MGKNMGSNGMLEVGEWLVELFKDNHLTIERVITT